MADVEDGVILDALVTDNKKGKKIQHMYVRSTYNQHLGHGSLGSGKESFFPSGFLYDPM